MEISDHERDDFEQALRDLEFSVDDFELIPEDTTVTTPRVFPITGTVTIRRKSSGTEKKYKTGYGSTWPAKFARDLGGGYYGSA